mmetsp:Transcript_4347/g.9408  ORF Transcript_4347/g.9408 Transcript_4347/m.9408 type:complete len:222 (+) Transcript_4347:1159-1824(+)
MQGRSTRSVFSVIGEIGPTRECFVLLVVQNRLLPLVVLRPFFYVEIFLQIFFRLLRIVFYKVWVVHVQVVGIVSYNPFNHTVVAIPNTGEKESMRGKGSRSTGREWRVMSHQMNSTANIALPVKVEGLVGHVDEFSSQAVKGRLDPAVFVSLVRIRSPPVKAIEVGFYVCHGRLRAVANIVREFFQCRIRFAFAAKTPGAGWLFFCSNKQQCRSRQGGESQ